MFARHTYLTYRAAAYTANRHRVRICIFVLFAARTIVTVSSTMDTLHQRGVTMMPTLTV